MPFAIIVLILSLALASTAPAQTIAIKAGKLIDPETATIATDQIILVEGKVDGLGALTCTQAAQGIVASTDASDMALPSTQPS